MKTLQCRIKLQLLHQEFLYIWLYKLVKNYINFIFFKYLHCVQTKM